MKMSIVLVHLVILGSLVCCRSERSSHYYDMVSDILAKAPTYYAELGVPEAATPAEIKAAYRSLSKQYHPDKNKQPGAAERYLRIQKANEVLSSEALRKEYDELLQNGVPWEEQYYGQYVHKYGVPQHDIRYVLLGLILIITVSKYAYQHYRYAVLTDRAKRTHYYKQKKNELKVLREENPSTSSPDDPEQQEPQIRLHGIEKPTWKDLFIIQLVLLPYTVPRYIWQLVNAKPKTEEEQKEELCLKYGITREELEKRIERQQRKMETIKDSAKYKKYMRMKKKGII